MWVRRRQLDAWLDDNADARLTALLDFALDGFCRDSGSIEADLAAVHRNLDRGAHGYRAGLTTTVQFGQFAKSCLGEITGLERELENSRAGIRLTLPRRWSTLPTERRRDLLLRHVRIRVAATEPTVDVVAQVSDR